MKTIFFLLVAMAGTVFAGEGMSSQSVTVRRISPEVVQGIKDLAVYTYPGRPDQQVTAITEGVEAWFELKTIPNNPAKRQAAMDFPYDFPKQLFLAQRGFLAKTSTGGVLPSYW